MEYLERPLIEGVGYEISETRVTIQSPNTCFVSYVLPERCQKDQMLNKYQCILRMAKEQGIRISYSRHIRKTIQEKWPDYVAGREKQEQLFNELRKAASTVQQRGIHMGHVDDKELDKVYQIVGLLDKLHFSNGAMSIIARFEQELYMLEHQLAKGQGNYDMIRL